MEKNSIEFDMYIFAFDVNQWSMYIETKIHIHVFEGEKPNIMRRFLWVSRNSCVTRKKKKKLSWEGEEEKSSIKEL